MAREAAADLNALAGRSGPDALVVLGTGLSPAVELLGGVDPGIDLLSLPGFHHLTAPGHRSRAWLVEIGGCHALVAGGRTHLYEGCTPHQVTHLVRTAICAGARTVVLTCSAGSLRSDLAPGELVAIADHLNLTGHSPLSGFRASMSPSPFVDLTDAWSPELRRRARAVRPALPEAVYAQLPGPHFETPAEIRMLAALGADLVGMSTVLEAIAARHLGAEVLGLAVAANPAAGTAPAALDLDEIRLATSRAVPALVETLRGVLAD